ncbi:dienelactone hydrolase family protein [Desulforhabdus sp. TSK]|uniref:dienelactone hydrolase family protein n=1 Tax=Desulforhabdus sp. TSK TaxID=2925014 RepID=UPI001FC7D23E|nr:dienelactone hydrolase family protein [Desulforhabdus sp. TSK]GKT09628.1 dienelactone hydrolase [Desulforhabdus sp. TSK]
MKYSIPLAMILLAAVNAHGAIHTEWVQYRHGETLLEGYLAYDDAVKGPRPGVLVVHEWMGLEDYAMKRAEQLAGMGYVAFALDMYGKGVRAKTPEEAAKLSGIYKGDRPLMRARAQAGLDELRKQPLVDPSRIAAIGYCFGGTTVLELARSGAPVAGVVSFHGGLGTPEPADAKNIKGKVLVLHGADDPHVPSAEVAAFQDEMRKAAVDWQMIYYGGAVHSFTNPGSGTDASTGVAYNEKADKRSWEAMKAFFKELF